MNSMKLSPLVLALVAASSLSLSGVAAAEKAQQLDVKTIQTVSPKLAETAKFFDNELWKREALAPKERSLVTLAAAISRDQKTILPAQIQKALDNGLTPKELSEVITHLAFYTGWENAMSAVEAAAPIYKKMGIKQQDIEPDTIKLLPLDQKAEDARAKFVSSTYGDVSSGVVKYTTDKLFLDLWLRPNLEPKYRSLITVSALISTGQSEQVPFHLNKAMDNGLTKGQVSEVLTQLAFYAGWPKVFSALPVVKDVLAKRK